jgi:hypothetical protein
VGAVIAHRAAFLLATDPAALTRVLGAVYRTISGYLLKMASPAPRGDTGAVTLIQRFGSALNLNVHFHMIFLDGVYLPAEGAAAGVFRHVPAPTGSGAAVLVQQIAERIGRVLEKRGLIERDMENAWLAATGQAARWMT